jgi:hypothetical protein
MTLPTGTLLSRVHQARFAADAFNPVGADALFGGGRFDATDRCVYGYMYAAFTDPVGVAETLLRDVPADEHGARFLARKYWTGRRVSNVRTTAPLLLIAIRSGQELGAIGQDTWLTTCNPEDYPQTRAWGHWLRAIVPAAAGIIWLSKRDPGQPVLVLFDDRCPPGAIVEQNGPMALGASFDNLAGFAWLRSTLAAYRVAIRQPRP